MHLDSIAMTIPAPAYGGIRKSIYFECGSTADLIIQNAAAAASSSKGFFAYSTGQAILFSTGNVTPKRATLTSVSSTGWLVETLSTGVTVIGTTV